jgi:hypothetical protein
MAKKFFFIITLLIICSYSASKQFEQINHSEDNIDRETLRKLIELKEEEMGYVSNL